MSWKLMERVLDLRLPDEQERVLVRLARHAADDGSRCFPGVKLLADETGRSERSVQRVLRTLEGARLIVPVANRIGGRGRIPEYRVTLPRANDDQPTGARATTKGDTHVTVSAPERVTPVTPIAEERVSSASPIEPERVTLMSPFSLETVSSASPITAERVTPVTVKGDAGDTSPSPPITPLSPSGTDQESVRDTTPSEPSTAPADQAKILRSLSPEARQILDWHRQCHGRRQPAKLTPASAEVLEAAVVDLGVDRIREAVKYMAGLIPPVPELSKAIRAGRTKRERDEGQGPRRNGTHHAQTTDQDLAARMAQRERMTPEDRLAAARQAKGLD